MKTTYEVQGDEIVRRNGRDRKLYSLSEAADELQSLHENVETLTAAKDNFENDAKEYGKELDKANHELQVLEGIIATQDDELEQLRLKLKD